MKPTPFNSEKDLAPIPFTIWHCRLAAELKEAGLSWVPHVGRKTRLAPNLASDPLAL